MTHRLRELLPDFGNGLAVDATVVRSWSNPTKRRISDPEASWTAKNDNRGKKAWLWGYKLHLAADTKYELPIAVTVTTASVHDSKQFVPVLERARELHPWLQVAYVTADAGYDSWKLEAYLRDTLHAAAAIKRNRRWNRPPPAGWTEARYATRQAVERCFSRLKGHRALDAHCRRGLRKVRLHILMAVLTLQAGAVARAQLGDLENVRHCTRKVA